MVTIYVVEMGEPCEGGSICGIFLDEQKALELQQKLEASTTWEWVSCTKYWVTE